MIQRQREKAVAIAAKEAAYLLSQALPLAVLECEIVPVQLFGMDFVLDEPQALAAAIHELVEMLHERGTSSRFVELPIPDGCAAAGARTGGAAIRVISQYDTDIRDFSTRIDVGVVK